MTKSQIKAFLAEHEIKSTEIAAALELTDSAISHTLAYRKRNPETQKRIEDYVRAKVRRPRLRIFDARHAPPRPA
jgi:hypothetical protein